MCALPDARATGVKVSDDIAEGLRIALDTKTDLGDALLARTSQFENATSLESVQSGAPSLVPVRLGFLEQGVVQTHCFELQACADGSLQSMSRNPDSICILNHFSSRKFKSPEIRGYLSAQMNNDICKRVVLLKAFQQKFLHSCKLRNKHIRGNGIHRQACQMFKLLRWLQT